MIILLFLITAKTFAQQDSSAIKKKEQGYISTVREKFKAVNDKLNPNGLLEKDSIQVPPKQKLDSAGMASKRKLDSLKSLDVVKGLNHGVDSITSRMTHPGDSITQKIASAESKVQHKLDSASSGVSKLNGTPTALQHKTDSLQTVFSS